MKPLTRRLAVPLLLLVWLLVAAQACDQSRPDADGDEASAIEPTASAAEPAKTNPQGDDPGALPGEAAPGTKDVEDIGGPESPAILVLSSLKGYLEPCGCSAEVLLGGIERITGYVAAAREIYPDTLMLDAGDMLFEFAELEDHVIGQEKAKADVIVAAQKALGTQATVPGERDFALGADFYFEKMKAAGVTPIAANLSVKGHPLEASKVLELGDMTVGVIGAVDPALYDEVEEAEAADFTARETAAELVAQRPDLDAVVLLMHGDLAAARAALEQAQGAIDFAIIGHGPRETDQSYAVGGGHTLEPYDQGRYVGVLKLYDRAEGTDFVNAQTGSASELEKIERQIAHVDASIAKFSPSERKANPPILQKLRDRLADLKARRDKIKSTGIEVPDKADAFVWAPVPMEPGYPINEALRDQRQAYNKSLRELAEVREPLPPVDGEPFFIGSNQCATCHGEAHDFWTKTRHAQAVETLEERDKLFDDSCIGCHVVGYDKPGGSVIGKLEYDAELGGQTIHKNLEDVGCETCHGPGSAHRMAPVGPDGLAQHITRDPTVDACMQCHVPEHSPRFNFEAYLEEITGPGHERSK